VNARCIHAVLAALVLIATLTANAEAQADAQDQPAIEQAYWYGWQTLLSDTLTISTAVYSAHHMDDLDNLFGVSFALSLVAPAVIHGIHGNWVGVGVSLGLRVGGTAGVLYGIASAFDDDSGDDGGADTIAWIGFLALIAAPIVDAAIAIKRETPRERATWSVQPWGSPRDRSGGLGVAGRF
jgi:hypothetical protein